MEKNFEQLTSNELWSLRKEIVLNSLFLADFENSHCFNAAHISHFFEGYVDYICELAEEDGNNTLSTSEIIKRYDNENNLYAWFHCYDDLSWITFTDGFRIGDNVKWIDLAIDDFDDDEKEYQKERKYTIIKILNDESCLIADDYGESEVFFDELEKIGE